MPVALMGIQASGTCSNDLDGFPTSIASYRTYACPHTLITLNLFPIVKMCRANPVRDKTALSESGKT